MNNEHFQEQLLKRLDVLIRLELQKGAMGKPPPTSTIVHRLLDLGLTPAETAGILGKGVNYVTAVISSKKKRAGKKSDG